MSGEKVRENRLRRMADRQGLRLGKSRRRDPRALSYGTYWLTDPYTNTLVLHQHTLSRHDEIVGVDLDDVEAYLMGAVVVRLDPIGERVEVHPDPGDRVFEDSGVPFLNYDQHAGYGRGWCLWYLDDGGDAEVRFFPGTPSDQATVVAEARDWLKRFGPAATPQ